MEVHDIVQDGGIKTIPKEKKCKKAKLLSEEALQIAVKSREVKGRGEKERYTHLNQFSSVQSLSRVPLFATPWTAVYQAPPPMGFFQARLLEWGAIAFSDNV